MLIYVLLALGVIFLIFFNSVVVVRQAEAIIIEWLGKYHRTLHPGIHIIFPFIERTRTVSWTFFRVAEMGGRYLRFRQELTVIDLREAVHDFPKQNVITKDNVTMEINALLYYQIFDPKAAIYEVLNLPEAIEMLTHSTLRNVIGSMDLDETLVSRDQINARLQVILDEATDKWGVKVNRVELQEINPPIDIKNAMEKQMRAERDRRAVILEAQGAKEAAILRAQGQQEAEILNAQGAAKARLLNAQAEADAVSALAEAESRALKVVQQALGGEQNAAPYLIAQQYIKALSKMTEGNDNKVIVVPYDAASPVSTISMIKEIVKP